MGTISGKRSRKFFINENFIMGFKLLKELTPKQFFNYRAVGFCIGMALSFFEDTGLFVLLLSNF